MEAIHRIPTTQYGYIEVKLEYDDVECAIADHNRILRLYQEGVGLSASDWKSMREHMLTTGEFDPNRYEELNNDQKYWVNQTKLALRGLSADNNKHK